MTDPERDLALAEARRCDEPGCELEGRACFLPTHDQPAGEDEHPDAYYCAEHAFANGFCRGCGDFWGGVESFEFANGGYCDNCRSAIDAEERDEQDWFEVDDEERTP